MTVTELHPTEPDTQDPGRQPPHDDLAERSVLGACLLTERAIDDAIDAGLKGRDFYRPAHEMIWDAIRSLHDAREPVDAVTVPAELDRRGYLSRAGGNLVAFDLLTMNLKTWNGPCRSGLPVLSDPGSPLAR